LFLGLVTVSSWLLINNNDFQRSRFMSVSQEITGSVHGIYGGIISYIDLKRENELLMERNAALEQKIMYYKNMIELSEDSSRVRNADLNPVPWRFIPARPVFNQVSGVKNFITLNKGLDSGVKVGMGVLSSKGSVVGHVMSVSQHFAQVIPLLNPDSKPNGKILSTNYSGELNWDGKDPRFTNLNKLPAHAIFHVGDTIVTGFSAFFPEGVPVGTVAELPEKKNMSFNSLKIKLLTDFSTLNEVFIVEYSLKEEQEKIMRGEAK